MKLLLALIALAFLCLPRDPLYGSDAGAITAPQDDAVSKPAIQILRTRCFNCHGSEKQEGDVRLDSHEAVHADSSSGSIVARGDVEASVLVAAIRHERSIAAMPPKDPLTAAEIEILVRWVADGARWPTGQTEPSDTDSSARIGDAWNDPRNPIRLLFGEERLTLWSLQPIEDHAVPQVTDDSHVRTLIDRFVQNQLESKRLSLHRQANPRALIRRLYLDLTGLPPPPAVVDQANRKFSDRDYEVLVDRLLASPEFGEHWGRMWLDVIRYGDSNGFDWDEYRPEAWRFRDYVLSSLNADLPFDQFVLQQLAGDEQLAGPPANEAERQKLIATGYLRSGPQDNAAVLFNEQDQARAELMADLVETTGSAFLAMTMSCCRCHDHKFDPLSQADHFRLRAFFENVAYGDDLTIDLPETRREIEHRQQMIDDQLDKLRKKIEEIETTKQEDRTEAQQKELEQLKSQSLQLEASRPQATNGLLMTEKEKTLPPTFILYQGDYRSPRELVAPGFLSALDPNEAEPASVVNPNSSGRRTRLAQWITSRSNPLTARVLSNRIWQNLFGVGIVKSSGDFGFSGDLPADPALLDVLALRLLDSEWSIKKLIREIVLSQVYRQAREIAAESLSEKGSDPLRHSPKTNEIDLPPKGQTPFRRGSEDMELVTSLPRDELAVWGQGQIRRLTAEQLRDCMLVVSGTLSRRSGGPPVWPVLPDDILTANPALLDDNETRTKGWYPSPYEQQFVRSVYLIQKRTVRVPFLETFDLPENNVSCSCRSESIVPPQALSLMNSPLAVEMTKGLAQRIEERAGKGKSAQVREAFVAILQREPTQQEYEICLAALEELSLEEFARAMLNLNEFIFVD